MTYESLTNFNVIKYVFISAFNYNYPNLVDTLITYAMIILLSPTTRVDVTPEVILENWVIQEIASQDGTTYHFIGFINERGRISTPIAELNTESKEGRTISGRLYKLVGPPGDITQFELNAIYSASLVKYKAISVRDVTLDFIGFRH